MDNGNEYRHVRDLGSLGVYFNGHPVELVQNAKRPEWYRFRSDGKRADVSLKHVIIFRDGVNPKDIKCCFDTNYRSKMH